MNQARWIVAGVLCVTLGAAAGARAGAPLAEHAPGDALFYLGWRGVAADDPGCGQSHLKGFLDATALPGLASGVLDALAEKLAAEEGPEAAEAVRSAARALPIAWRRPWAAHIRVGAYDAEAEQPPTALTLRVEACEDGEALAAILEPAIEAMRADAGGDMLVDARLAEGVYTLTIGSNPGPPPAEGALPDSPRFARTVAGVEARTGKIVEWPVSTRQQ